MVFLFRTFLSTIYAPFPANYPHDAVAANTLFGKDEWTGQGKFGSQFIR